MDSSPTLIAELAGALSAGDVILIPTDTVYGLACDPFNAAALRRLFELKQRPEGVPVAVLVGSAEQTRQLVDPSPLFDRLANNHWPGGLTLIGTMHPEVVERAPRLGLNATLGVRWADHPLIAELTEAFGPIAATSANLHGEPTIVDPAAAHAVFGNLVTHIVDMGILANEASTVVDATGDSLEVLRQGTIRIAES